MEQSRAKICEVKKCGGPAGREPQVRNSTSEASLPRVHGGDAEFGSIFGVI